MMFWLELPMAREVALASAQVLFQTEAGVVMWGAEKSQMPTHVGSLQGEYQMFQVPESALITTCPKAKSIEIISVSNDDSSQERLIKNTSQALPDFNEAHRKMICGILSPSLSLFSLSLYSHIILVKMQFLKYNRFIQYWMTIINTWENVWHKGRDTNVLWFHLSKQFHSWSLQTLKFTFFYMNKMCGGESLPVHAYLLFLSVFIS